jgi:double-strand break repair protein MRE11
VALVKICGKEFDMEPISLRTVRPFVIEGLNLLDAAEEEGFDPKSQVEVAKFLRSRVGRHLFRRYKILQPIPLCTNRLMSQVEALIVKANELWEERQAAAIAQGETKLEPMLPLVRLKVDTTGVSDMSNPVRFGHEFTGRLANPRDVLVFHRSAARKSTATGTRARGKSAAAEDMDVNIGMGGDEEGLTTAEKLGRVRVQNLVREYLEKQELQLLGELGMGDAIETFVEKDDTHAITMYVGCNRLLHMMRSIHQLTRPQACECDPQKASEGSSNLRRDRSGHG